MAKKRVVVDLNLRGTNSVAELEQELKLVNQELKLVDRNSDAFTELSQKATMLRGEMNDFRASIKPISDNESLNAWKRLGEAMAGAFQVGGAAMLLFSEDAQENFEEIAKVVGSVVVAMDGLGKMIDLFKSNSIKALLGVVAGWKSTVAAVWAASAAIRAAIIATGIGALVVGIGLVIANWNKLTDIVSGSSRRMKRAAEDAVKSSEQQVSILEAQIKLNEESLRLQELRDKKDENSIFIFMRKKDLQRSENELAKENLNLLENRNKLLDIEIDKTRSRDKLQELLTERAINKVEIDRLKLQIQRGDLMIKEYSRLYDISVLQERINDTQGIYNKWIKLEETIENNSLNIYKLKRDELEYRIEKLKDIYETTKDIEDLRILQNAEYDLLVLNKQEEYRVRDLKLQTDALINQRMFNQQLFDASTRYKEIIRTHSELINQQQIGYNQFDNYISNLERADAIFKTLKDQRESIANFDKTGVEIYNKYNEDLINQLSTFDEIFEKERETLTLKVKENKWNKQLIDDASKELGLFKLITQEQIKKIDFEKEIAVNRKAILEAQREEVNGIIEVTEAQIRYNEMLLREAQMKFDNAKNDEERAEALQKITELEATIQASTQSVMDMKNQVVEIDGQIVDLNNEILNKNQEQLELQNEIADKQREVTQELEKQSRGYALLQSFVEQYKEEIQAAQELIGATFELTATIYDNIAAKRKQELDDWVANNKDAFDEIADMEKSLSSRRDKLNEMLKMAEGQRYRDILDELANIDKAEQDNANSKEALMQQQAEMQHKIDMAEYNGAIMRKAAGIADATINTALGITEALPNIILAGIVGALGAIQIGTIAAQPLPPKPEKPKFELGGEIIGNSHSRGGVAIEAEGGEFIVNKDAYSKYGTLIRALNESGRRKFANGGEVTPNVSSPQSGDIIDYNLLANTMIVALKANPMFVSVTEIRSVENRLKAVESKTSF